MISRQESAPQIARCFAGAVMGWGSLLIPGSTTD
jgi:hypothetical protein